MYTKQDLTGKLTPIRDKFLLSVKDRWFSESHKEYRMNDFVPVADEWFKSTRLNNIQGWDSLPCVDFTQGCTHYIESTAGALGWKIQVLPDDYSVYAYMGINPTQPGELEPGVPLMISLPQWRYVDLRSDWESVLSECESKSIDIHIDMAWLTVARDVEIDLAHPCIQSVAMSISKYASDWNRCGLRWSKQRRMDSITLLNHYYPGTQINSASAGYFMIDSIPRDYLWNTYADAHYEICKNLDVTPSKIVHVVKDGTTSRGIGDIVSGFYDSTLHTN